MPGFWDWRERRQTDSATTVALEQAPLEPVELYTRSAMVFGLVDPEGRRLSDMLNSNTHLAIRDPRSTSLHGSVDGTEGEGWSPLATDEILLVMPPEHVSPRQLRIHRRQHRVRITTGPYVVVGNAHAPPGVGLEAYSLQKRIKFLAVTQAAVYSTADSAWERMARVVLVNVRTVEELTEVLTIS
jgi:hypothetical protein